MYDKFHRFVCVPSSPHPDPAHEGGVHPHAEFVGLLEDGFGRSSTLWHCPVCWYWFEVPTFPTDLLFHDVEDDDRLPGMN